MSNFIGKKPKKAASGDIYFDIKSENLMVFNGSKWVCLESISNKKERRENIISSLLDTNKFEPIGFGFEPIKHSIDKYFYKNGNYDGIYLIELVNAIKKDFYVISYNGGIGMDIIFYRGRIPNINFALELFKNINFDFLPIIVRERKISDILN